MGRHSIIDDKYILSLWEAGYDCKTVAERAGCSKQTAYVVRYKYIGHISPKENNEKRKRIVKLFKNGYTITEIGKEVGVSRQRVQQVVKEEMPNYKPKEKVLEERNQRVVGDYKNGVSVEELLTKYNISNRTLYDIFRKEGVRRKKRKPTAKKVIVSDIKGNKIGEYPSIMNACNELGIEKGRSNVSHALHNGKTIAYGYRWEYANE